MLSVIVVTINGDMFLFKNNDYTKAQYDALQRLADSGLSLKNSPIMEGEKMICSHFVEKARKNLHISLESVEISFVVRIK